MKPIRAICLTLLLTTYFAIPSRSESPTKYVCNANAGTGFAFKNGEWRTTKFSTDGMYFFEQVRKSPEGLNWRFFELGQKVPSTGCTDWWYGSDARWEQIENIICDGHYKVRFNKTSLRLLLARFAGYTDGDNTNDTPTLFIGKCSPL